MSIISPESWEKLVHRGKSFLWRLGAFVAVAVLEFLADNLGLFNLSPEIVVLLALVLGEVTKFIKVNIPEIREARS